MSHEKLPPATHQTWHTAGEERKMAELHPVSLLLKRSRKLAPEIIESLDT